MPRLATFVLLCVWLVAGSAVALESAPATSSRDTVTLVTDTDAVAPGTPFRVGLRFAWRRAGTPTGATRATPAWRPNRW